MVEVLGYIEHQETLRFVEQRERAPSIVNGLKGLYRQSGIVRDEAQSTFWAL
jgi:hypothetical protein